MKMARKMLNMDEDKMNKAMYIAKTKYHQSLSGRIRDLIDIDIREFNKTFKQ